MKLIAPYLIVTGQDGSPNQVVLAAKQTILLEVEDVMKGPAALLAMHLQYKLSQVLQDVLHCIALWKIVLLRSTSMKMTPSFSCV